MLDQNVGITSEGIPVDLVVTPRREFGTALIRAPGLLAT